MKEKDFKYIGRVMYYSLYDGRMRTAICQAIEFRTGLGPVFIGESPHGHIVRLTKKEIHRIL